MEGRREGEREGGREGGVCAYVRILAILHVLHCLCFVCVSFSHAHTYTANNMAHLEVRVRLLRKTYASSMHANALDALKGADSTDEGETAPNSAFARPSPPANAPFRASSRGCGRSRRCSRACPRTESTGPAPIEGRPGTR